MADPVTAGIAMVATGTTIAATSQLGHAQAASHATGIEARIHEENAGILLRNAEIRERSALIKDRAATIRESRALIAEVNAQIQERNAKIEQQNFEQTQREVRDLERLGELELKRFRRSQAKERSKRIAALGAAGVQVSGATVEDIFTEFAEEQYIDEQLIKYNVGRDVFNVRQTGRSALIRKGTAEAMAGSYKTHAAIERIGAEQEKELAGIQRIMAGQERWKSSLSLYRAAASRLRGKGVRRAGPLQAASTLLSGGGKLALALG